MAIAVEALPIQLAPLLGLISGSQIEKDLFRLAQYGGEELPDGKIAVTRLALSSDELAAREFLTDRMQGAGMKVQNLPFGLVGVYRGRTKKDPVVFGSHFDSVEQGGMCDGDLGVMGAIEVVRILNEGQIVLPRPLEVVAFTGEESSRFQLALFGSKLAFFGLTEEELALKRPGDISIEEAFKKAGFGDYDFSRPYFGVSAPKPYAVLELHISQDGRLADQGYDLGVVEAIAAPDRFKIEIGSPAAVEISPPSYARYLRTIINGTADHSGSTPMGLASRADGLAAWANLLTEFVKLQSPDVLPHIAVGSVDIEGQALNKIPGRVSSIFRFSGDQADSLATSFGEFAHLYGASFIGTRFDQNPITLEEVTNEQNRNPVFFTQDSLSRYLMAARVIQIVEGEAENFGDRNIVGTVGTFHINNESQLILGVDIRGIDLELRNQIVRNIQERIKEEQNRSLVCFHQLSGSSEPTILNPEIVKLTERIIRQYGIGSCRRDFSRAGHDSQNAARAGIPTVLIFTPSRAGGISHNPSEYSTPKDLKKGVRAFAAAAITLACQ